MSQVKTTYLMLGVEVDRSDLPDNLFITYIKGLNLSNDPKVEVIAICPEDGEKLVVGHVIAKLEEYSDDVFVKTIGSIEMFSQTVERIIREYDPEDDKGNRMMDYLKVGLVLFHQYA